MAGESSGAKGFAFFGINVDLTEDGIEHVDHIVTLAFQVRPFTSLVTHCDYFVYFMFPLHST